MDGLPPGAVSPGHYLVPVPGSYLIPGRKTRKTSRAGSRPLSCRRRCFLPPGTALPSSQIVSRYSKQRSAPHRGAEHPKIHRGAEHPKIHPDPATGGPRGTTHNPSPAISAGRGLKPIWMSPSCCHQSQRDELIQTPHSRASISPGRMKAPVLSLVSNSSIPKPPFAHLITSLILSPNPKSQPQFN